MSEPPDEGNRDSIPLLLARTSPKVPAGGERQTKKPPPRRDSSLRAPSTRRDTAGTLGYLRSRLGAAGTLVAAMLVLIAIFADMLASDLPSACKLHGHVVLFPNVTQPAELVALGGEAVGADAEWKVSPLVTHGPNSGTAAPLLPPGAVKGHPFGTDHEGRDVFARVVHGARTYLVFALAAVVASLLLGGLLGSLAGLFGGGTDALVSRAIETVSAFPPLVLVLGIQAAVPRPTVASLFLAIALTRWPEVARLVRAEVMRVATRDYVMAARALGASPLRVLRKHIAPNVRGQLVVLGTDTRNVEATATLAGPDTVVWGGRRVVTERIALRDSTSAFTLWLSPEGHMLRLESEDGQLVVMREPPATRSSVKRPRPK